MSGLIYASAIPNPVLPGGSVMASRAWCGLYDLLAVFNTATASAAWPASSRAIFQPFEVQVPSIAKQIAFVVGATSSGNIDVGIYDLGGNRLVSKGSTAMSASTNAIQVIDITDTLLQPGVYYAALAVDNTTGTTFRWNPATQQLTAFGVQQAASAFVLPTTVTYANPASAYLPDVAVALQATL